MKVVQIEWITDSMFVPAIGETKRGGKYNVPENVASNLVKQGVAKPVKTIKEERRIE